MLKYNKRHYPAIAPIDVDLDYTLIEDFLWENYDRWQNNFEAHSRQPHFRSTKEQQEHE